MAYIEHSDAILNQKIRRVRFLEALQNVWQVVQNNHGGLERGGKDSTKQTNELLLRAL